MNKPAKRLIVNADDFGLTDGVSRGIFEAHGLGIVTSTTVMVGAPNAFMAIGEALINAPKLGLGLHLTLSGTVRPVLRLSEIPSLVRDDWRFYPFEDWLVHYPQFNPAEIERELNAQVERFIQLAGKPPDHLDGHHHSVYRHPAALHTMLDIAARYNIPIRRVWSDHNQKDSIANLLHGIPDPARETALTEVMSLLGSGKLPPMPDRFEDTFYDTTATLGDLLLLLTNLPEGVTEIMCHPGYAPTEFESDYTTKREDEKAILTHTSVREVIKSEGIDLITFGDLQRP